jgi:signal transduction histidine kinase
MFASKAHRIVDRFVPAELQLDPEKRRIAGLLIAASTAAAPITLSLAAARWLVDGTRSRVGALAGLAACAFAVVPFVVRATASLRAGAVIVLATGVFTCMTMACIEGGLASEALLWMSLVPIAAALLRGEHAVRTWSAITLGAIGLIAMRDLRMAHESQIASLGLHTAAAVGAVAFAAVLGRSYEAGRARSLRELETRERRFRRLVQAMPDALLRIDESGRIVDAHVPNGGADAHGTLAFDDGVVGAKVTDALPSSVGARILALAGDARASGRLVRDDALSLGDAQLQVVVVLLPEGDALAILRDVSALAAAERERAVSEKRADLLASSLRQRDEFLSVASHELRTPLTAMKLWVQRVDRMPEDVREHVPSRMLDAHAKIAAQVTRLETLVDELLDVSRLLEDRLRLEVEPVHLDDVARDVVTRFELEAARLGCKLQCALEPTEGEWDRSRLDQIATNLISNALKYAPGRPIDVLVRGDQQQATLSVRDRGVGIAAADQARIFDRFERLADAKRSFGLGLGLWITRRLVESMGGRIEIESRPGEGSTFTVILPTHPPPESGRYYVARAG